MSLWRLCIVAVVTLTSSCAPGSGDQGLRVALITPGSIADAAWNAGAFEGLTWIRDSLHLAVSHVEARTPGEQEEALRAYAAQGYGLIFGHGFEFQDPAERVARDYPDVVFAITSGQRVAGNVVPVIFRFGEATYLAGLVAGSLSRSGRIGFVGGIELPPVRLAFEAWEAGARAANPTIESRSTYLNTFDDAVAGREAALALIGLGVDMLHHNADAAALGVFQAVKATEDVYVFGANADQRDLAPARVLGSAIIDLPLAFLAIGREVRQGRFTPEAKVFGLASGVVRYVPNPTLLDMIPDEVQVRVSAAEDSLRAGTLAIPGDGSTGPGG